MSELMPVMPPQRITLKWLVNELIRDKLFDKLSLLRLKSRERTNTDQSDLRYFAEAAIRGANGQPVNGEVLCRWLATKSDLSVHRINPLKVDVEATSAQMSKQFSERHDILCIEVTSSDLVIAVADPFNIAWVESLEHVTKRKVKRVLTTIEDLCRFREEFYSISNSVAGANGRRRETASAQSFEQLLDLKALKDAAHSDQHVVNIVDWLLQYAFDQKASDIHIEPRRDTGRVRLRIDGLLQTIYEFPSDVLNSVTSRLKVLARMDIAEKRRPQDGRIKTRTPKGMEVELRLSTLPTVFGEKLVMRIFDPEVLSRSFAQLGLQGIDLARWKQMTGKPHGVILVTGPTGSGKTTTLYSTLKTLATDEVNVSTIEDPIEMVEPAFNQTQVQANIGVDFSAGIRTLLRQDPDIIMVGEIRDEQTAEMAIQASLTGHLVFSTLHTNDAPSALSRLSELGVPNYLLRTAVSGVMAQRLVRKLCERCKQPAQLSKQIWIDFAGTAAAQIPDTVYQAVGCKHCRQTGYSGREGIYELMLIGPEVMKAMQGDDWAVTKQAACNEGMVTLRQAAIQKVLQGVTSMQEAARVIPADDWV